jgi:uncharacterized delta-60 repeat protein
VVIGGDFTTVNGVTRNRIARLNGDGSLDTGFQNGMAGVAGAEPYCFAVAVQSDGKVLIGGSFATVNGVARNCIARLNDDGSLDTGFQNGMAGANHRVLSVAVQSDGKVLIGGNFDTISGVARNRIARLNNDGSLDTGFMNGLSGADNSVSTVAVQSDGKVIIGGTFTAVNGGAPSRIARLNSDGSLDTGFLDGCSGADNGVFSVVAQSDGKVLLGGYFGTMNGVARNNVARLIGASDTPPQITAPMQNQTNAPGGTVTFSVGVSGTEPISYLWLTNDLFVQASSSASFSPGVPMELGSNFLCTVIVSNQFGMATNRASAWGVIPVPAVALTNPSNNQSFAAPATMTLQAAANGGAYGATVTGVGFFSTSSGWLGTSLTVPYSNRLSGWAAGTNGIFAIVTNNWGTTAVSGTNFVTITNIPLAVTLAAPTNNQTVEISAHVILQAGTVGTFPVTGVGFFSTNGGWLTTALTPPYSNRVSGLAAGTYGVYAVATNSLNETACSVTNIIAVLNPGRWVAYLDHLRGTATSNRTTVVNWDANSADWALTNVATGVQIPNVGLHSSRSGSVFGSGTSMSAPVVGTPAWTTFSNYCSWNASSGSKGIFVSGTNGASYTYTFTGLNPTMRYAFSATAVRGAAYAGRWLLASLQGAESFSNAHSSGVWTNDKAGTGGFVNTLTNGQALLDNGVNQVSNGDVVGWTNISVGTDGQFSIKCEQWTNTCPNGVAAETTAYAFLFTALRLEQGEGLPPNRPPVMGPVATETDQNVPLILQTETLLADAYDPDGDPLTISGVSPTSTNGGSVMLGSGCITYNPVLDYVGLDRFTFTISDGSGGFLTNTVAVTVIATNAGPPNIVFCGTSPTNGSLFFFWAVGQPGLDYTIEFRTNLADAAWLWRTNVTAGTNGMIEFTEDKTALSSRFYRTIYPAY